MEMSHRICKLAIVFLAVLSIWAALPGIGLSQSASPYQLRFPHHGYGEVARFATGQAGPAAPTTDFLASEPAGWTDLMPQDSLQGWTRVSVPPGKVLDPVNQWSFDKARGTILCEGTHGHEWLRFDRELSNFLLHVEWRFEKREGGKGYNSGVFIRNDREGRVWHQAQVGAAAYIFGQTLVHGELSPTIKTQPPAENPLHPIGEWNTYEIRCDGPKIRLWANGQLAAEFLAPEVPRGYWGLEAEGYRIEFRNIKLKNVP